MHFSEAASACPKPVGNRAENEFCNRPFVHFAGVTSPLLFTHVVSGLNWNYAKKEEAPAVERGKKCGNLHI